MIGCSGLVLVLFRVKIFLFADFILMGVIKGGLQD
jgi:hypothetical protein